MELRPSPARWFELVVSKTDADDAMEALARRGRVQFEWTGDQSAAQHLAVLREPIARYHGLAHEHQGYWPDPVFEKRCCDLPVEVSAQAAMRRIERWVSEAEPSLQRLARLGHERRVLGQWLPILAALSKSELDLGAMIHAEPVLAGVCAVVPGSDPIPEPHLGLQTIARLEDKVAVVGVVPREELAGWCLTVKQRGGECLPVPDWFEGSAAACDARLVQRLTELDREIEALERSLRRLAIDRGVDKSRGIMERIEWFRNTATNMRCDGQYCWITGWTSERNADALESALQEVGIASTIDFVDPPRDAPSPSVTHSPAWLAPFEIFTHAVGVPGIKEADPTTWVAFLVPLMFGYMCGDVGHGAVIIAAGFLLRRQTGLWPLLVVCGLAAVAFGFVYGGVFGHEDLLDPLWIRPMEQPVTMLVVPVIFGAIVLSGGVLLHAVQTCWRGQGRSEGVADAAQLLVYWGILLAFGDLRFAWLSAAGAALCLTNRLWTTRSPKALLAGIGHQAESTFTMLLHTLSFARVGAFALAHAALETAIMAFAGMVSSTMAAVVIMVTGNLLVILLEGLVVSIQTTRLVLFEFFARFFEGGGRKFQPAPPPPSGPGSEQSG